MNNWKIIPTIVLATVLIFGAGVFCGGMLVDYVKQSHPRSSQRKPVAAVVPTNAPAVPPAAEAPAPKPPEFLTTAFLQRLDHDLHLTKAEHEAVQKVICDGQNAMRKVVQDARLEIREVLTPEQRDQFDELIKRPFHKPLFNTNAPALTSPPAAASGTNSPPP